MRSGNAPAGDASRDERTLDLFGDPVLEPNERVPAAARDEAGAQAEAAVDVADDVASGRQAALDGFSAPDGLAAAGHVEAAEGAVTPEVATVTHAVSSPEGGGDANVDVVPASGAAAMTAVDIPLADGVATKAADMPAGDGAATVATKLQATDGVEAKSTGSQAADGEVEKAVVVAAAAAVKSREGRSSGDAAKERRASSGGKRRTAAVQAKRQRSNPRRSCRALARCRRRPGTGDDGRAADVGASGKPVIAANTASTANTANTAKAHDAVSGSTPPYPRYAAAGFRCLLCHAEAVGGARNRPRRPSIRIRTCAR